MGFIGMFLLFGVLILVVLMCYQESQKRRIGFVPALLACIFLTPLFGYFIIVNRPLRNAISCINCGNDKNEADICGVCGKRAIADPIDEIGK